VEKRIKEERSEGEFEFGIKGMRKDFNESITEK